MKKIIILIIALLISTVAFSQGYKKVTPIETTSTTLDLSNVLGNLVSMTSANAATTYTITGAVANGYAQVLINTTSEPTVTGATKTDGAAWITGTNMYLVVWNNGNRSEYYFLKI